MIIAISMFGQPQVLSKQLLVKHPPLELHTGLIIILNQMDIIIVPIIFILRI